ncbi:putative membrane protein [Geodermatophilus tzadiensis]|uniref:Putative membrane protein n=2 Tax=Geodermatophilus tzadiensis TaxID=1137988 RepID=A0A2T0TYF4_9ACTN|nr:putative membrane protein [Geodermatophilus tzadiensis]
MGRVPMRRIAWGALAWVLTLQFFVVETVVQLRAGLPYSRSADTISALGDVTWPGHTLMNASFVVQAGLIGAGAVALLPALRGRAARPAVALLGAAALGVLLVGVFPRLTSPSLHTAGAALYLVGGAAGLVALAYAVRPWSEAVGTTLALLGLLGAATTVFYGAGVVGLLGAGGTERVAAYVVPIGLALTGPALWRLTRTREEPATGRPTRRQLRAAERERERAARVRREAERDDALQALARRAEPAPGRSPAAPPPADPHDDLADDHADDDLDPDDPWAGPRRR